MVSVDPIITLATRPAKLSGDTSFKIDSNTASAPLPETGRIIANGMHSSGNPRNPVTGDIASEITSSAPEALNIPIAVISAIRAGSTSKAAFKFSAAPSVNSLKMSTRLISPIIIIKAMKNGITKSLIFRLFS